jgi:ketosteroid isomerase-like protein
MVRLGVALLAAIAVAGCGGPSDQDEVRATLAGYAKAFATRDYQALCDRYFDPKLVSGLEQSGLPCEAAVRPEVSALRKPSLKIGKVTVDGDRATADVHTTAANQPPADVTLALVHADGRWRIASTVTTGPQPAAP